MSWASSELRVRLARGETSLSPPVKYFYCLKWPALEILVLVAYVTCVIYLLELEVCIFALAFNFSSHPYFVFASDDSSSCRLIWALAVGGMLLKHKHTHLFPVKKTYLKVKSQFTHLTELNIYSIILFLGKTALYRSLKWAQVFTHDAGYSNNTPQH